MLYWLLKHIILGPVLKLIWRPRVEGLANIPDTGPAILASNHLSFCDSIFLPVCIPRRVTFLVKAEYFTSPGVKGALSRLFFSCVGQVSVDRSNADLALAALHTGVRLLGQDKLLGIYPEGTRSPDGRLHRGKTGVARLALDAGVAVIPVAMINTNRIQPTGRLIPHLRPRPRIRIGPPVDFSRELPAAGPRSLERVMTDEIMCQLLRLSGQQYVDLYAADVKAATGTDVGFGAQHRRAALDRASAAGERFPTRRAS